MRREFDCMVEGVEKHILPRIYKVHCNLTNGGRLTFEFHEELELSYSSGEELKVVLSSEKIPPSKGNDYCGKVYLYKVLEGEEKVYLFSMGGYIFRLSLPVGLEGVSPAEWYYVCVSKKAG